MFFWMSSKTQEYIEAARKALGANSDGELARALGIKKGRLSHYITGRRVIDNWMCAKLAEVLELPPIMIIAAAEMEREKDEGRKSIWRKFLCFL